MRGRNFFASSMCVDFWVYDVYVFVSYSIELSKGMELVPFYNFDSQVPDKAKDMLIKARMDILNGKLKVPYKLK